MFQFSIFLRYLCLVNIKNKMLKILKMKLKKKKKKETAS